VAQAQAQPLFYPLLVANQIRPKVTLCENKARQQTH
jgi:hypothetical protein